MRKGFTAVELMIGLIIMSLLLTALYRTFSATRRNAAEIVANHSINDDLDRTLLRITDDIRESNLILPGFPEAVEPMEVSTLATNKNNKLKFEKFLYDYSKDPSTLAAGEVNYTKNEITYYLEPEDDQDPNSPWTLQRSLLPYNNKKQPENSQASVYTILRGIRECVFYRLNEQHTSGGGNVYIRLKLTRIDAEDETKKYSNEITISVKERGANPE
ncbi:MAG: hypothetical protein CVV41_12340 [Candidatus Riflebacteria bacterium HGW-Riflebacteria-1]|jgi:prepilin-type N-terminal cleavage/methylation domain-containing protein|nr:MAG: hypothetical protein CVV41_12340 [Candidatus Riflebacteria bacterium HGW-Riflebacteria-1]